MSPPALRVNQNQSLDLPTPGAELTLVKSPPEKGTYTVQPGDTQWTVSQKLGVDLVKLTQLNPEFAYRFPHIARVLQPGEKIALTLPTGCKSEHPNWSPAKPVAYAEQAKPSLTVVPFKINKTEDNAISLQREWGLWPAQLQASRHMVQDIVPNILNGNIPMVMGATLLPKQGIKASPVILNELAESHTHTPELGNIGATRAVIEGMFAREAQTSITLKVFKPDTSTPDGKGGRNPKHGHEKTLLDTKHHAFAWGSGAVSIELGRVSLADDATKRMRTATITTTVAVPLEHMYTWKKPDDKPTLRSLNTYALGEESTYRVATEEARLKNMLTGKLPLPDPFALTNMKVGDQVTLDNGGNRVVESEWRAYVDPGVAVDAKYDSYHAEGNRLVITAATADPKSHAITSVVVASGASITEFDKVGLGGILNPSMTSSDRTDLAGKAGNLGAKGNLAAGYVRALAQVVKSTNDNHFNFVEIDLTKPEGKALYAQILKTGDIPPLPVGKAEAHIKAHGKIDYELDKTSTVLQLAEYAEKIISPGYSSHMSASQNFELTSRIHVNRKLTVDYARIDSHTRSVKQTDNNAEGSENYFPKFGFAQGEIATNTVSFNNQTVSSDVATDRASTSKHELLNLKSMTYSVPASKAVAVFQDYAAQTGQHGTPAYTALSLLVNDPLKLPSLKGQDAITHLKNMTDPNATWVTQLFTEPSVDMVWKVNKDANIDEFLERLSKDVKAYQGTIFKSTGDALLDGLDFQYKVQNDALEIALAALGVRSVPADNILKVDALSRKTDILKVLDELASTNPSSFIEMLNDFHDAGIKAGGNKAPYPISVTYVASH